MKITEAELLKACDKYDLQFGSLDVKSLLRFIREVKLERRQEIGRTSIAKRKQNGTFGNGGRPRKRDDVLIRTHYYLGKKPSQIARDTGHSKKQVYDSIKELG